MDFPLKNMLDAFKDDIWDGKTASVTGILFYILKYTKHCCIAGELCIA